MRRAQWLRQGCVGALRSALRARVAAATLIAVASALAFVASAAATQPNESWESAISAAGPVAWFRFNDASGSKTVGDAKGAYTAENDGIVLGGEGPFRGSGSGSFGGEGYATVPGDPLLGDSAFTVEGWVYWSGGSAGQPLLELAASTSDYLLLTPSSTASKHPLALEIVTPSGSASVSSTKFAEKQWEYVAVKETSEGRLLLYLNGKEVAAASASVSPASLGASVPYDYVGRADSPLVAKLHASLSNLTFYSKALSEAQIAEHYDVADTPVDVEAPKIEGEAKEGATLKAAPGRWASLEAVKYSYNWERCTGSSCQSVKGGTKETYVAAAEAIDSTLRVTVTARNNTAEGQPASSAQSATVEGAPMNSSAPTIKYEAGDEEPKVGEELTVASGEWRAFPLPSFGYLWETCPKTGECAPAAEGANGEAGYRVTNAEQQQGDKLRVTVTAQNALGKASAVSATTAKVAPGKPVDVEAPTITGEALEGEPLSVASSGHWAGTEPPPVEYVKYAWLRCPSGAEGKCEAIEGASGSRYTSYTTSHGDVGDTIEVQVTAKNSVGEASATSQPSARIRQKPLRDVSAPTIEGEAREGQQLKMASRGTWEGAPTIEYVRYEWLACSAHEGCVERTSGATETPYTLTSADVGDTIELQVTAQNPETKESATSKPSVTVVGNPPANVQAPTIAGTARDEATLTASPGEWTGTPPISYGYQWEHLEGAQWKAVAGATSASYTIAHEYVGQTLRVAVRAENSVNHTSASSAASEAVQASAPVDAAAPIVIENLRGSLAYTVDEGSWRGTPPLSYSYRWESCGALAEEACLPIAGADEARYTPEAMYAGEKLRVVVTASNAAGEGSAASARSGIVHETGGETVAWGDNYWGQLGALYQDDYEEWPIASAPGLSGIATVAAGGTENLALLADHQVDTVGNNAKGQLGDNTMISNREADESYVTVETDEGHAPLEGVQAVAAASNHAMALGENHWVYTWGEGTTGQLGNAHGGLAREWEQDYEAAEPVHKFETAAQEGEQVVQIATGGGGDYALLKDGEVRAWGRNVVGQLGVEWKPECEKVPRHGKDTSCEGYECGTPIGWEQCRTQPEQVVMAPGEPLQGVKAIYAGYEAAYALVGDGELLSWGDDGKGQLGQAPLGKFEAGPNTSFTPPGYVVRANGKGGYENVKEIVEVAVGFNHVLARLADGEVLGWGDNQHGELGEAAGSPELCDRATEIQCFKTAQPVKALEAYWRPTPEIEQLSAGSDYSDALIGHEVYALGGNEQAQLGVGATEGPESCATKYQQEKELEKIKKENEEREKEGKKALPEVAQAGSCSRKAVPVAASGSVESDEEGAHLTRVSAIEAGTEDGHTQALLEPGVGQPPSLLNVSVGEEGGTPLIDAGWGFDSPFQPQRLLYRLRTLGPESEPPGEGGGSEECEQEEEAKGKQAECPAEEARPHIRLDYEQFQKETEELTGKEPKNEKREIPRVRNKGTEKGKNEEITLTTEGNWTGAQPISYTYQWERCEGAEEEQEEEGGSSPMEETTSCEAIPGAGGKILESERPSKEVTKYNYELTEADVGYRIRVKITATNEIGPSKTETAVEAVSEATQPVRFVGEANPDQSESISLKGYPNPGSYKINSYKGEPLIEGKVYEAKISSGIWAEKEVKGKEGEVKEKEGWTDSKSRKLIVPVPKG